VSGFHETKVDSSLNSAPLLFAKLSCCLQPQLFTGSNNRLTVLSTLLSEGALRLYSLSHLITCCSSVILLAIILPLVLSIYWAVTTFNSWSSEYSEPQTHSNFNEVDYFIWSVCVVSAIEHLASKKVGKRLIWLLFNCAKYCTTKLKLIAANKSQGNKAQRTFDLLFHWLLIRNHKLNFRVINTRLKNVLIFI
jgi:hypothetical protein